MSNPTRAPRVPRPPNNPPPLSQHQYETYVNNYNRQATLQQLRGGNIRNVQSQTNRLLLMPQQPTLPQPSHNPRNEQNWRLFQNSVRQNIVWHNVRSFIAKIKDLPVKRKVPKLVRKKIEPKLDYFWEDDTLGWNSWRPDVLFVDFAMFVFNCTAIFFFSVRTVLYKVDMGAFPMLYIIMMLINALYRCNTKIIYRQHVIVKRKDIIVHYLSYGCVIDCTLIYLCILQLSRVDTGWYRLIIFIRLYDHLQFLRKFQQVSDVFDRGVLFFTVFKIYLVLLTLAHMVALTYLAMVSKDKHPSWMQLFNYSKDMDHWIKAYIRALYWGMGTLTISSFGDTYPTRTKQTVIVTLIETVGVAAIAYWVLSLVTVFSQLAEPRDRNTENLRMLNRFLESNRVPFRIQKKLKQTVRKMSLSTRPVDVQDENQLIGNLSPWLKDRLLESVHLRPMMAMSLWNRFSLLTIKNITTEITRKLYYQTEVIIAQNDIVDSFYMLRNGRIYETHIDSNLTLRTLSEFHYLHGFMDWLNRCQGRVPNHYLWLGLQYTVQQSQSPNSFRSKGQSLVISIPLCKVKQILLNSDDQRDYESYCVFRDSVKFAGLRIYQISCLQCPGDDHNILACPYYHYIPNKTLVVLKYAVDRERRRKFMVAERRLQPRIKGGDRRVRMPWVRVLEGESVVVGSLAGSHGLQEGLRRYQGRMRRRFRGGVVVDEKDIRWYLTTLEDADSHHDWVTYYPKSNANRIKLHKSIGS